MDGGSTIYLIFPPLSAPRYKRQFCLFIKLGYLSTGYDIYYNLLFSIEYNIFI